jgi:glycosyltransferase involved in cell wall biosynthesis
MRIAYLTNQYPKVSHSFIRREIGELEDAGVSIWRYAIRPIAGPLVEPADQTEAELTKAVLAQSKRNLISALIGIAVREPLRFARGTWTGWRLSRGSTAGLTRHLIYLLEACWLTRELRRNHMDHVHVHFGTNPATVAVLSRALGGPSFSFTMHGPEEFDRPEAIHLRDKVRAASFVVGVSHFTVAQLCRWSEPNQWPRLKVVRCGVDRAMLREAPTPVPDRQKFVCVGRLCEQKGQLFLLQAIARLRAKNITPQLVLVGDGPLRGELERFIADYDLSEQIEITGWASADAVQAQLRSARALVLPSLAEGLPVVLMEALVMGRPVISTYIAGIPELVESGQNGWLVPAGDVAGLEQAIEKAMTKDPEQLSAMGECGREKVRCHHDPSKNAVQLTELFREATGKKMAGCH